jgi:hypothetical protein
VAVVTADLVGLRLVRQTSVAALTRLMAFVQRGLVDARLVTTGASHDARERQLETMRFVAAGAGGAAVRAVIRVGKLVT